MVRKIGLVVMSTVEYDVRCRQRKIAVGLIVENGAFELQKGKRRGGGNTYGRGSMITAIFFLRICQVRSSDLSCLSGGVTVHRMPQSWRRSCEVSKAFSLGSRVFFRILIVLSF